MIRDIGGAGADIINHRCRVFPPLYPPWRVPFDSQSSFVLPGLGLCI